MQRHVVGPRFYDRNDGVIRIARAVQFGVTIERSALEPALTAALSQSQYARALRKGHDYLWAAGSYIEGSIDRSEMVCRIS
jgi:hypothetical protein